MIHIGRPKNQKFLFPEYLQIHTPDFALIADLINIAKGEKQSLREFARKCGCSPSTLSRILNPENRITISDELLMRIYENAVPDSKVTLDDLLRANGFVKVHNTSANDIEPTNNIPEVKEKQKNLAHHQLSDMEKECLSILRAAPLFNDYVVAEGSKDERLAGFMWDVVFKLSSSKNKTITTWACEIKRGTCFAGERFIERLFYQLYLQNNNRQDTKFSLVITDATAFKRISEHYKDACISDNFSVILINLRKQAITNEFIFRRSGV